MLLSFKPVWDWICKTFFFFFFFTVFVVVVINRCLCDHVVILVCVLDWCVISLCIFDTIVLHFRALRCPTSVCVCDNCVIYRRVADVFVCICGTRISGLSSDKPDYPGHWSGLFSTSLGLRECAFSACIYPSIYIPISIAHPHRVFISTLYVVKAAFWLALMDNGYCVVVAVFVFAPNDAWHWKKAFRQPGDGLTCVSEFYSTKRSDARLLVETGMPQLYVIMLTTMNQTRLGLRTVFIYDGNTNR